jgi:hypothetical protein
MRGFYLGESVAPNGGDECVGPPPRRTGGQAASGTNRKRSVASATRHKREAIGCRCHPPALPPVGVSAREMPSRLGVHRSQMLTRANAAHLAASTCRVRHPILCPTPRCAAVELPPGEGSHIHRVRR